jgi:N-acetylmuramoyl-L-alanine amidase
LRAVIEPEPEHGTPDPAAPAPAPEGRRTYHPALPWVAAVAALILLAGIAGLGTAYLVASLQAVPSPDAAFLPTPTPGPTPRPVASPASPEPTERPTAEPTPEPTAAATAEPTPGPTPLEYTVQRGDSIGRIALRFGVTPESIIALNELSNPNRIFPGQVLLIPTANASPEP